ncbi:MAG TPA: cytochrome c oxidase assembly protein [Phenylobacterium sp.]|nr:cytochrome c oxidase assembly protein [Phenylobacterium sp.]
MLTEVERRRNMRVAAICAVTFFGMVGAAFAAVPLYKAFCQATGFDGNPRRVETAADRVLDKTVTVRFDANVNGLPWTFTAEQASQQVKIGETKLAFFKVTNHAATPVTARAVYNVTPETAGAYFNKLQCFCFSDQTIAAGATVEMPVLYFIDPKYASDVDTKGEPQVTLSYTFFPAVKAAKSAEKGAPPSKG